MDKAQTVGPNNFASFWCSHQDTALPCCASCDSPVIYATLVMPVSFRSVPHLPDSSDVLVAASVCAQNHSSDCSARSLTHCSH